MSLWNEIQRTREELRLVHKESVAYGKAMNAAECKYYTVKDMRVRELMNEGFSGNAISMIIKGEKDVNDAMQEFLDLKVEYVNSCEGINILKKDLDTLREQYQREWGQAGRDY